MDRSDHYTKQIGRITADIRQLNQNVQTLNQYVEKIGQSGKDESRTAFKELVHNSNVLSKNINSMIKELVLGLSPDEDRQLRVQRERLTNDYMSVLNRLQATQRRAVAKEKAQITAVSKEDETFTTTKGYGTTDNRFQQIQQQHQVNLNEIRERQQALDELEQDINGINQIFKDLSSIIHDQGEMVDSIEANIEHTSIHVGQANTTLNQALVYQKKARQKKIILSVFCVALLLIILLVIYLWRRT